MESYMNYPLIIETIKDIHSKFTKKYSRLIEKNVNERHLGKETVYSRLTLLGKAFQAAGIIDKYEEVSIAGSDRNLAFITKTGDVFYFLNGNKNVIFLAGNSTVVDMYKNTFLLPFNNEDNRIIFKDVISDDFDWVQAAKQVLEIIHKDAYRKTEVLNDYIDRQLSIRPDGN